MISLLIKKIKKNLKDSLPDALVGWYLKKRSAFSSMSTSEIFTHIYNSNHWKSGESVSGTGSELTQVEAFVKDLERLFVDLNVRSILDIPCGDFNWMKTVDLTNIRYTGADIVVELITRNQKLYSGHQLDFQVLDIITDDLPQNDLIIVRDCFVHFSYSDISKSIKNIKKSGSRYLLSTTFQELEENSNIATGDWRPLNLRKKPFNFPDPMMIINENCTEENGKFRDKSLGLWAISRL